MAKASKATQQVRRKRWVSIIAPKVFNEVKLAETYVFEPQDAVGKIIQVSAMQLTGEPQKQYISVGFTITSAAGERLMTALKSYKILPSSLRRMVRRNKDKFEDSFKVRTQDMMSVLIKPFVVTRYKAQSGILSALRKEVRDNVALLTSQLSAEQLFVDIISGKFQRAVYDAIRKTYPVAACEMRWMILRGPVTGQEIPIPVKKPEPKKVEAPKAEEKTEEKKVEAAAAPAAEGEEAEEDEEVDDTEEEEEDAETKEAAKEDEAESV